jgi:hypothetical protein
MPKKWGGLGIKDLERFGRALRLRWLRYCWDDYGISWKNLLKYQDKTDRTLLFASTMISVGNGKTPHSGAKWLNGAAPRELAVNLYQQAHYRYRIVHQELQNLNWIENI